MNYKEKEFDTWILVQEQVTHQLYPSANLSNFSPHVFTVDGIECETIAFLIQDKEHDWAERKEKLLFDYYKNGEFSIEDNQIVGYNCDKAQAFMPIYNLYKEWARQDALQGKTNLEKNLPIFKRYVQLTLEGKMFFGVQISKIESVTLELC